MGAVVSHVWDAAAPLPPELIEAHIAERFHLSPQELDGADAGRLYHWFVLLGQEDLAREVRRKMEQGETLSKAEREWCLQWMDYIPAGVSGVEALRG